MFDISKTTFNMAKRRGLDLEMVSSDDALLMTFWDNTDETTGEWMFSYRLESDGMHFNGNIYLNAELKEELPAFIPNEKSLRSVIEYIGINRHMWKD